MTGLEGDEDLPPDDLRAGPDGGLYISEDRNGTVLRLIKE
jgi:glucose/arabinose dehydrogenase